MGTRRTFTREFTVAAVKRVTATAPPLRRNSTASGPSGTF